MKNNNAKINRTLTAATVAVIKQIAEETAHQHKTLWGKPGVESMHRIGSEICHIVRKGTTERKAVKGLNVTKDVREELALVLMDLGEDCGHHRDSTYRKIGKAVMAAVLDSEIEELTFDDTLDDQYVDLWADDEEADVEADDVNFQEVETDDVETDFQEVEEVEEAEEVDEVDDAEADEVEVIHTTVDLPPDLMENLIHNLMENLKSDNE